MIPESSNSFFISSGDLNRGESFSIRSIHSSCVAPGIASARVFFSASVPQNSKTKGRSAGNGSAGAVEELVNAAVAANEEAAFGNVPIRRARVEDGLADDRRGGFR